MNICVSSTKRYAPFDEYVSQVTHFEIAKAYFMGLVLSYSK